MFLPSFFFRIISPFLLPLMLPDGQSSWQSYVANYQYGSSHFSFFSPHSSSELQADSPVNEIEFIASIRSHNYFKGSLVLLHCLSHDLVWEMPLSHLPTLLAIFSLNFVGASFVASSLCVLSPEDLSQPLSIIPHH